MTDDELCVAQAKLRLRRIGADALIALAERALAGGRDSQALRELAALARGASLADVERLFVRLLDELGVPPMSDDEARERLLWVPARRIATAIVARTLAPLAGARAIQWLADDFGSTKELADFCDAAAMTESDVNASLPKLERTILAAAQRLLQR